MLNYSLVMSGLKFDVLAMEYLYILYIVSVSYIYIYYGIYILVQIHVDGFSQLFIDVSSIYSRYSPEIYVLPIDI